MLVFQILLLIALVINIFHTYLHWRGCTGRSELLSHKYVSPMVSLGWVAWAAMLFTDPSRVLFGLLRIPALIVGIAGIVLVYLGHRDVPFEDSGKLVTTGVFAYIRHPIYYGSILCLVGFPIAVGSLHTLYASLLLATLNLYWRHIEEKNLAKRFGNAYLNYKKRVKL